MKSLIKVFSSREMFVILLLGFSSGLPLSLTGATLQAWMSVEGVSLKQIGLFALVGLPYTVKYIWAPVMDRYVPPFLGRRRGWMLVCQVGLACAISALAFSNPAAAPTLVAALALTVAFLSASQDIVVDAYRSEIIAREELGAAAGVAILGYRLGMLTSGALALILSDHLPWQTVYLIMASSLSIGILGTLLAPEPAASESAPRTIVDAVIHPFIQYFQRSGALEILAFILLFKLGEVMSVALTTPFMLELGFTKTDIGLVTKGFGLVATICGSMVGGAMTVRIGLKRGLFLFGLMQAISPLCFAYLAIAGKSYPALALAVGSENFFVGLGTAPFIAFLMSLCDKRYTATQYALLTSLAAMTRVAGQAPMGYVVDELGWVSFFLCCAAASAPALILLALRFDNWEGTAESPRFSPSTSPSTSPTPSPS